MPRPSHSSRFYHPHNNGRGVQIMGLQSHVFWHKIQKNVRLIWFWNKHNCVSRHFLKYPGL
jgi:hypothetical protein